MAAPVDSIRNKKYVGNDQKIKLTEVYSRVLIVGNKCFVDVTRNEGKVIVIGDDNRTRIHCGYGDVEVIGNNARLELGENCKEEKCSCTGNNSKVCRIGGNEKIQLKNKYIINNKYGVSNGNGRNTRSCLNISNKCRINLTVP